MIDNCVSIPTELVPFIKVKVSPCELGTIETYSVIATDPNGTIPKKYSHNALDDNTYLKYPALIKLIPRGFSVLLDSSGKEICRLDGLEKFDGSCPLDDDDEVAGSICEISKVKDWKNVRVEFQEKANGKMAIFKVFKYRNAYWILGGSKNLHVIVPLDKDITGTGLHYDILRQVQKDINKDISQLLDKTTIGEYVDGQHIVWTDTKYMTYFSGPLENIKRLFPDQNTLPSPEQLKFIRDLVGTEGAVIKYINLDTGEVFRQKHKSIWYIFIRCMREGLRHYSKTVPVKEIHSKIKGIFKKRSNDFLHLTDAELDKWNQISLNFIKFVGQSKYDFSDIDNQKMGIGIVWHEFENCGIDFNSITVKESESEETLVSPELFGYIIDLVNFGIPVCVIMRGLSGSGKSTVVDKLSKCVSTCVYSTDQLFIKDGEYNFDKSKLAEFHETNYENFKKGVDEGALPIVDNTNITHNEYFRYADYAKNRGYVCVFLHLKALDPELLAARSTHNVPAAAIRSKIKAYKLLSPSYYGLFIDRNECKIFNPKQRTPLHVTMFFGSDEWLNLGKSFKFGQIMTIKVISYITNKAGRCLCVEIEGFSRSTPLHITLETFSGFKPVDVGTSEPIKTIPANYEFKGIFGPNF
jgi:predicted kinase